MFCNLLPLHPPGLLTTIPAASAATANMLQQLLERQQQLEQQQQRRRRQLHISLCRQQREVRTDLRQVSNIAARQLTLYEQLLISWPPSSSSNSNSSLSSSSELAAAALPAVQLAVTLLEASAGELEYVPVVVVGFFAELCSCLHAELQGIEHGSPAAADGNHSSGSCGGGSSSSSSGSTSSSSSSSSSSSTAGSTNNERCLSPAVQQLLQSEQLLRLLAASQAFCELVLHANACSLPVGNDQEGGSNSYNTVAAAGTGTSAAAAAAPTASATAAGLLRAVGFGWAQDSAEVHCWNAPQLVDIAKTVSDTAAVMGHMLSNHINTHTAESSRCCDSSSNSSNEVVVLNSSAPKLGASDTSTQQQQQQQQLQFVAPLLQPWALLQLQLMQLVSEQQSKFECATAIVTILNASKSPDAAAYEELTRSLVHAGLQLGARAGCACHWQQQRWIKGAASSSSSSSSWRGESASFFVCAVAAVGSR
jgi:hypothetical protein